jgi:hypothetical protein
VLDDPQLQERVGREAWVLAGGRPTERAEHMARLAQLDVHLESCIAQSGLVGPEGRGDPLFGVVEEVEIIGEPA